MKSGSRAGETRGVVLAFGLYKSRIWSRRVSAFETVLDSKSQKRVSAYLWLKCCSVNTYYCFERFLLLQHGLVLKCESFAMYSIVQVNSSYSSRYSQIPSRNRQTYLGMITALDDQIQRLVNALKLYGFWNNTVFVFYSDVRFAVAKVNLVVATSLSVSHGFDFQAGLIRHVSKTSPQLHE